MKNFVKNEKGFIAADFLFSMVLVISSCIILFSLCYSLVAIQVGQYITWSAARAYSSANLNQTESEKAGQRKFDSLIKRFPLLTGQGADAPWFVLKRVGIGNDPSTIADLKSISPKNSLAGGEPRQPWTGAAAEFEMLLLKKLRIPFIGKLSTDDDSFTFKIRAFLLRNPSQAECLGFFSKKYLEGVTKIEDNWQNRNFLKSGASSFAPIEDNGC